MATLLFVAALSLAGCGGDDGGEETAAAPPPAPDNPNPPASPPSGTNGAPTISGSPPASVLQGTLFNFLPTAEDPDDDTLTFSIEGMPGWATFSSTTGRLRGTPGSGDIGQYADIVISVSDGDSTTALASFSIEVVATATGSATLNWTSPTQRTDGTALTNLAGFKVYWGVTQGNYPNSATIDNAGITTFVVDELTPGTWFFVATALDSSGVESDFSNVASKTIL